MTSFTNVNDTCCFIPSPECGNQSTGSYRERSPFYILIMLTASKCSIFNPRSGTHRLAACFSYHSPLILGIGIEGLALPRLRRSKTNFTQASTVTVDHRPRNENRAFLYPIVGSKWTEIRVRKQKLCFTEVKTFSTFITKRSIT